MDTARQRINGGNDSQTLRPSRPDVAFAIDEHDDLLEDQGEGMVWRRARDQAERINRENIVDLMCSSQYLI